MAEESSGYYFHSSEEYPSLENIPRGSASTLRKQSAPAVFAPNTMYVKPSEPALEPPSQTIRSSNQLSTNDNTDHPENLEDKADEEEHDEDAVEQEPLPYPGFVPVTFKYFKQTDKPRMWCLQLITYPYPFTQYNTRNH